MAVIEINQSTLDRIKDSEFSVLLFYASGCHHCEAAKPYFERFSIEFPFIQFLKADFSSIKDYYDQFAEEIQEVIYERDTNAEAVVEATVPVLQYNEDGTPKMVKKYMFPTFYIHHTKAITPDNPYGFIGGFDGNNPLEVHAVLRELTSLIGEV